MIPVQEERWALWLQAVVCMMENSQSLAAKSDSNVMIFYYLAKNNKKQCNYLHQFKHE